LTSDSSYSRLRRPLCRFPAFRALRDPWSRGEVVSAPLAIGGPEFPSLHPKPRGRGDKHKGEHPERYGELDRSIAGNGGRLPDECSQVQHLNLGMPRPHASRKLLRKLRPIYPLDIADQNATSPDSNIMVNANVQPIVPSPGSKVRNGRCSGSENAQPSDSYCAFANMHATHDLHS